MDYLFDHSILYHSEDGTLHFLEAGAEDIVTLTPVLNRILVLLIAKQGQLITKEEFLIKVWDNYGRAGSSHTLNQYLSTLRKIFHKHLNKKGIITIAKQGYMLSPDIIVSTVDDQSKATGELNNDSDLLPATESPLPLPTPVVEKTAVEQSKLNSAVKYAVFYAMLTLIAITLALWLPTHLYSSPKIETFPLGMVGQCPVFTFSGNRDEQQKKEAMEMVDYHVSVYHLTCAEHVSFYFYSNENGTQKEKGSYSMLTRCARADVIDDECLTTRVSW